MKTARKLGFALALIGGLCILALVLLVVLFPDAPPVRDDKELILVRVEVKPEDNAFTYLNEATNSLWSEQTEYTNTLAVLKAGPWTNDAPPSLLVSNVQTFALIDRALACPKCQVPEIKSFTTLMPYISSWRSLARLTNIKARYLWRTGKTEEALAETTKMIRLGQLLEDSDGPLIAWLVAVACKGIGLGTMEDLVQSGQLTAPEYKQYASLILAYPAHTKGLQNVIRTEYLVDCNMVDELRSKRPNDRQSAFWNDFGFLYNSFLCRNPFVLQPEATKKLFQEYYTLYLHSADHPLVEAPGEEWFNGRTGSDPGKVRFFLKGNALGRIVARMTLSGFSSVLEKKAREDTHVRVLAILMALKVYQLEHKEQPATLRELVPDYLPAVPMDPYDGKPLRYSREKKIVYSVGRDFKDSGGRDTSPRSPETGFMTARWTSDDIVFYLDPSNRLPQTATEPVRP